jgi:hypothetical protein
VIEEMLNPVGRLFLTVTAFVVLVIATAWLPNDKLAGEAVACSTPVPLKETVCGLLLALSVIVSVPVRLPVAVGVKITLIVQLVPAARDGPHVVVFA